jgi:hypothetical protein
MTAIQTMLARQTYVHIRYNRYRRNIRRIRLRKWEKYQERFKCRFEYLGKRGNIGMS